MRPREGRLELRTEIIPRSRIAALLEQLSGRKLTHACRHFVGDLPIHCGDILELYHEGAWVAGRYEWTGKVGDAPTFNHAGGVVVLGNESVLRWPT